MSLFGRYFSLFILLLITASPSFAATTSYDYSTRTPDTNIFAYNGILSKKIPTKNTSPSSLFSSDEYSAFGSNDGFGPSISTTRNNRYPAQRYVVKIDEDEASVGQIDILWNGLGANANANSDKTDGVNLNIWNYDTSAYQSISDVADDDNDTESEVTLSYSITRNITDYIGGSSNNTITLFVVSNDKTKDKKTNIIITDYVKV
ncbi:MAG: hypothetical protein HRT38_12285, partial [Alteromonadaceae bacterium]|nr:hypothetical protein [Alteromonadaceae bacterium]